MARVRLSKYHQPTVHWLLLVGAIVSFGVEGEQSEVGVQVRAPADVGRQASVNAGSVATTSSSAVSQAPVATAKRDDAPSSSSAVRELTSLLLKGQALLLEVAEKQERSVVDAQGERSDDALLPTIAEGRNSSARTTFDSLEFKDVEETIEAVLSDFLSDLAVEYSLGGIVSAQGRETENVSNLEIDRVDGFDDSSNRSGVTTNSETATLSGANSECVPSMYASPKWQPPKLLGGALAVVLNGGECRVVSGVLPGVRKFECDSPSVEYALVPPGFEWQHRSPEMWGGRSCNGETTWCSTGGTFARFSDRGDVPWVVQGTESESSQPAQSKACHAASKDSLVETAFEQNANAFKIIHGS